MTADAPLMRHTEANPARPLPAAIHDARADLGPIVADMLAIPEAALERDWSWTGGGEADVRYGLYRPYELFERAQTEASRSMGASLRDDTLAAALIAPSGAARWDLHGLLAPLSEAEIDADAGGGEWSIRQTLGHIVNSQRGYGWGTAWWQDQGFALDDPDLPQNQGDAFWADLPDEETTEQQGSLEEIRARLDAIVDLSAERLAGMPEERANRGARWSGFAVPIAFRLGRWSSHLREHTIQIEKALVTLGRTPTEPERLIRLTLAAYGRAEAVVLGQADADAAAGIIRAAVSEARVAIADARGVAEA
ncbi:MAG: DinB family protein [Chloroflexi bacterium]|nr:DinB family protein [Chloroflexota bacterium]